ncbi:MAG: hydrogenase iron-sulfur subunit [Proteobacteria bacterium]|nr:hydrogenase iron-sulfur subunit [Pseudomonadota bacterium]
MRLDYPANIKVVRVPCTGKVDLLHILAAFENGADGVYVAGCLEGECHFLTGNLRAKKRVMYVKGLLEEVGILGERVAMYNLSAAEGARFAQIAREMTDRIRGLGPSPIRTKGGRELREEGEEEQGESKQ